MKSKSTRHKTVQRQRLLTIDFDKYNSESLTRERLSLIELHKGLFRSGQLRAANKILKLMHRGFVVLENKTNDLRLLEQLQRRGYLKRIDRETGKMLVILGLKRRQKIKDLSNSQDLRERFIMVYEIENEIKRLRDKANGLQKQVSKAKKELKKHVPEQSLVLRDGKDIYTVVLSEYNSFKISKAKTL